MGVSRFSQRVIQLGLSAAILVFLLLCWGAYQSIGWAGFDRVVAEPWGFVTLADLFLGGLAMAAVIFVNESNWQRAVLWIVPIFFLGHTVSALWVIQWLVRRAPMQG